MGGSGGKRVVGGKREVFGGNPSGKKTSLSLGGKQPAEDLKAAANRWLADGVYILGVLPFPPYKTAAADADRSKAPEIGMPPQLKLPHVQRATLSNGPSVGLAGRHKVPLVSAWMPHDAG